MGTGTTYVTGQAYQAIALMGTMAIICVTIMVLVGKRKSLQYRKYLADLYVAAKIRFFAEEDKLDLIAEEKSLKTWTKKQSAEYRDVDDSVAEELKDRIAMSSDELEKDKK